MDPQRIRVDMIQLSAAVLSLCPWFQPARDVRTHTHTNADRQGRGAAASDSLAVARETMSSQLTPVTDDITCPNRLEKPEMT